MVKLNTVHNTRAVQTFCGKTVTTLNIKYQTLNNFTSVQYIPNF